MQQLKTYSNRLIAEHVSTNPTTCLSLKYTSTYYYYYYIYIYQDTDNEMVCLIMQIVINKVYSGIGED